MKPALTLAAVVALVAPAASQTATPVVRAHTTPAAVGFGDAVVYVVEATGDGSVSIEAPTAPFIRVGSARIERTGSAVRLTQRLVCLAASCLSRANTTRVRLPPPRVRIGTRSIVGDAASVAVRGRVSRNAVGRGDQAFRRDTSLPAADAAFGPASLALAALALVLGLIAFALLRASRAPSSRAGDAVARAIRLLRESSTRETTDRRRAAALLALVAKTRAPALSDEATTAAWARPAPAGDDVLRLAGRAQRELT